MLGLILLLQSLTVAVGGAPTSPEYLPVRVAHAEGYFAREGLRVTVRATRSESGAAEAVRQGQADLAATSLEAVLRFGRRRSEPMPLLVFGLTAAPPVALLVAAAHADDVRSVKDLAGKRIGFASPGGSDQTWLLGVLARAHIDPGGAALVSLGSRGIVQAIETGDVHAAVVPEPAASALVADQRASVLVDLRSPRAVTEALGTPTVNAAVFTRADRRVADRDLAAFARALLEAQRRIARETPSALAERLPAAVVGVPDEFERRVERTRPIYVADGLVAPEAVRATIEMVRTHVPLPRWLTIPRAEELLHQEPLRRALRGRPPA